MKDYLNQNEQDIWLIMVLAVAELENSLPMMANNLTKDEVKCLKTVKTLTRKAYNSVADRLGDKAIKKLHKYGINSNIQVLSKTQSKIISQREVNEQYEVKIDIDILFNLATGLTKHECKNCNKKCSECYLFELLQDINFIGYEVNDNCPYSFSSEVGIDKSIKNTIKVREDAKKSRHNKKFKNRYDDDKEIHEYNTRKTI